MEKIDIHICTGNVKKVAEILDKWFTDKFLLACLNDQTKVVIYLLDNYLIDLTMYNNEALKIAIENDNLELLEVLLERDFDLTDENFASLYNLAESNRNLLMLSYLKSTKYYQNSNN